MRPDTVMPKASTFSLAPQTSGMFFSSSGSTTTAKAAKRRRRNFQGIISMNPPATTPIMQAKK